MIARRKVANEHDLSYPSHRPGEVFSVRANRDSRTNEYRLWREQKQGATCAPNLSVPIVEMILGMAGLLLSPGELEIDEEEPERRSRLVGREENQAANDIGTKNAPDWSMEDWPTH